MASSTGSPASRMSTKLVPFTTRPLSTSRQGITRFKSMASALLERLDALGHREPPLVKRLARDHACKADQPEILQRAQVVHRGDAPRVDEPPADDARNLTHLVEVRPLQ